MIEAGLIEEVKSVQHLKHLASLQTVGYKEVFDYLDGVYTYEMCVEKIKQHTRNYAKRQLTWFRRHPEAHWIPFTTTENMAQTILQIID
jgi:tRNA dimethylallyltransferase